MSVRLIEARCLVWAASREESFTASEMHRGLKRQNISRPEIYEAIISLVDAGELQIVKLGNEPDRSVGRPTARFRYAG
jgi:hypothetical protein